VTIFPDESIPVEVFGVGATTDVATGEAAWVGFATGVLFGAFVAEGCEVGVFGTAVETTRVGSSPGVALGETSCVGAGDGTSVACVCAVAVGAIGPGVFVGPSGRAVGVTVGFCGFVVEVGCCG
jgi:hypothetical protein